MAGLGTELGLDSIQTAQGVIEIVNAHMERALRLVTIERGYDPEEFILFSFGGAGGLHAATLARRLSIPMVIIPPLASTLSAFGMLVADVVRNYSQTVMYTGSVSEDKIFAAYQPLVERGQWDLQSEGFSSGNIRLETSLDIRYLGQSYELEIPFSKGFLGNFHRVHHQLFGYSHPEGEIEIVNIRLRAVGINSPPELPSLPDGNIDPTPAFLDKRPIILDGKKISAPLFRGEQLQPGNQVPGPAIVVRSDTTVLLPQYSSARVDRFQNLVVAIDPSSRTGNKRQLVTNSHDH
jgi:N-methylhydantoinase A